MSQESQAPLPQIFNGPSYHHVVEHKICIEGGKPIEIKVNLHSTGDVASHKEIIIKLGEIMSAISDFVTAQKQFNQDTGDSIDDVLGHVTGIEGDIKSLNDKITELQNNPGPITAADQALLDGLQMDGKALADKAKAASDAIHALDAKTPPVAPPTP